MIENWFQTFSRVTDRRSGAKQSFVLHVRVQGVGFHERTTSRARPPPLTSRAPPYRPCYLRARTPSRWVPSCARLPQRPRRTAGAVSVFLSGTHVPPPPRLGRHHHSVGHEACGCRPYPYHLRHQHSQPPRPCVPLASFSHAASSSYSRATSHPRRLHSPGRQPASHHALGCAGT